MSRLPILLDTNVASFIESARPQAALYEADLQGRRRFLSFQTLAELRQGADFKGWQARRRRALNDFIDQHGILYPTAETCQAWGHLGAVLRRAGVTIETADQWIAACALTTGMPLAAHDAVFRLVPGLKLICHAPA